MERARLAMFPSRAARAECPGANAYSLNATVVPPASLGFLSLWNAGGAQPTVSTLNASDGSIVAMPRLYPRKLRIDHGVRVEHHALDSGINGYFAP